LHKGPLEDNIVVKPAETAPKTAGLAIAAFMQQEFHKSASSLEVSTNAMDSATDNDTEVDRIVNSKREMQRRASHTQILLSQKVSHFPTLQETLQAVPTIKETTLVCERVQPHIYLFHGA